MCDHDLPQIDRDVLRKHLSVLQDPIPLDPEPYAAYAEKLDINQEEVFALLSNYLSLKIIRRVAGVLKHNKAGFTVNGMVAMVIPDEECDAVGTSIASLSCVSHCYHRTAYSDWPYTLYAMVHAKSEEEFEEYIEQIKERTKKHKVQVLRSVREFKKTAFRLGE